MEERISFGIGCFHFGVKKKPPFKFEGSEYLKKVRTSLQSISNIDRINVKCEDEFENWSMEISEDLPKIDRSPGFFPNPLFMDIEFEVYIPFRIQAELLEVKEEFLETFTEKFSVWIHYTYHFPVTFIQPIAPSERSIPSDAVIILRKFLKEEFESLKDDYIQFEFLGPSPFHANCYVQSQETQGDSEIGKTFRVQRLFQKGYDEIIFEFNKEMFADKNEAVDAVKEEIKDELGFFYDIVQSEVVKMHEWSKIVDSITQLNNILRLRGIMGVWKRLFTRSKLLNEVFSTVVEFESEELFDNNNIQSDYRNIYKKEEHYFQSDIDKQIKERFVYPTKQIYQLIEFLESRRLRSVENLVVLISAILGGAIGAILIILLSN